MIDSKRISNSTVESLLLNLPILYMVIDPCGLIKDVEIGSGLSLTLGSNDFIGKNFESIFEHDLFAGKLFHESISKKQPIKGIIEKGGYYFETNFTPQFDSYNQVEQIKLVGIDITEKLSNKEKLINNAVRLNNLVHNLPGLIFSYQINPDGTDAITYASKGIQGMLGLTAVEAVSDIQEFWNKVDPQDVVEFKQSLQESARNQTSWQFEWRVLKDNTEIKWLFGQGSPQQLPNNTIVWDILVLDVTPKRQAENNLEQSYLELSLIGKINMASLNDADTKELAKLTLESYCKLASFNGGQFYGYVPGMKELSFIEGFGDFSNKESGNTAIANISNTLFSDAYFKTLVNEHQIIVINGFDAIQRSITRASSDAIVKHIQQSIANLERVEALVVVPLIFKQKVFGLVVLTSDEQLSISKLQRLERFNKQVMAALSKSHAQFEKEQITDIVESADVAIISKDWSNNISSWNKAAEKLFGYKSDEIIGRSEDLLIPESLLKEDDELTQMMKSGVYLSRLESKRKQKNGEVIDVSVIVSPIYDRENNLIGVSKIFRDISESKKAQVLLKESEEQLKVMIESVPAGVVMFDKQMNYLACSKRFLKENGLASKQIIGKSHYEIFPHLPESWKEGHKKCLEEGIPAKNDDDVLVRADGTIEYLRWEIQPWKNANGEIGGLVLLTESLSESKKAKSAIQQSERRLSNVLSIIGEGVWDWDIRTNKIWNNKRWCELLGLADDRLEHNLAFIKKIVHPDDLQGMLNRVQDCLDGKSSFFSEHRIIAADGSIIWVKDRGDITERDENGKPIRMAGSIADITQRKLYEAKLKESSDLLAKLTNEVPGMLYQFKLKPDGTMSFPYSSEGIREIYELSPEQVKNDASVGIKQIHPDDADMVFSSIKKSAETLKTWQLEYRVLLPAQGLRWRSGAARPERLEDGSVLWHGYIKDITEKKKIELEKEQYFKFFNASNDIMGIANPLGYFEKINPAFHKMMGYDQLELLAKPYIEFVHPDDIRDTLREMQTNLSLGLSIKFENRFMAKDGSYKWLSWTAYLNKQDNLTYATARDITEKKQTETALIESEKNLQTIFELTPIPLLITRFYDGTIIMANEATELLLGYKMKEVVDKHGMELFMDEGALKKIQDELAKKGQANNVEVNLKTITNEVLTCLISCEIIYMNGEIALISSVQDITQRKHFEEELIAKNKELKKTNVELDRFVYSTSHDLRAPLLSVLGLVEICESYHTSNAELQNLYKMMRTSINRTDDTIKSILDYSRNARTDSHPERLDVKKIVKTHIENIRHMKEAKQVDFILNITEDVFYADKMRFTTIVQNLITNAVKYQRQGESNPFVKITFYCNEQDATLLVSDNGEGIPEDKIDKVFGMFVRLSTKSSGSGLGLYMCREMTNKMGGTIDVTSVLDKGTTFTIQLPNQPKPNNDEKSLTN